jgi:hypothetical protein
MNNQRKFSFCLSSALLFILFLIQPERTIAQRVSKLTITDNLSAASALSYGTPKPAAPRDQFVLNGDKGAKVLVYLQLEPDSSLPAGFQFRYLVNRMVASKEEWVDERVLPVKSTAKYSMAAFTLFDPGRYHFVVTDQADEHKVYAEGWATVIQP